MTIEYKIEQTYDCDVLVIGSGVAGYCAAIQAARADCDVILIEKDEVLGGNSSPNLGVGITGADRYNSYATETGIIHEIQETSAWHGGFTPVRSGLMPYNISRLNEAIVQEYLKQAGVKIFKRHYAKLPIVKDNKIVSVIVEDLAAFRTLQINIRNIVIDASGDGHIAATAGADFDVGSEAKNEYNERSAPDKRTKLVQGTSLVAIAYRADREIPFIPPAPAAPDIPEYIPRVFQGRLASFIYHHTGMFKGEHNLMFLYMTETGGQRDTIRDDAQIYEDLLNQLWAKWNHIKNGEHKEQAKTWDLLWVSPKAGKRESRRFLGDYILTQTDLEEGRCFEDDIAYGGHDLDDHQPLNNTANIFAYSIPPLYGISYRCCYSRNIDNLLLAGRLISATHIAHSSVRVMRTGGAIGQAVGLAASLCKKYNCKPREIYTDKNKLKELQKKLQLNDATILAKPLIDENDLARLADISASSELTFNNQAPANSVPLISQAGILLWDWPEKLNALEMHLINTTDTEQKLTLRIFRSKRQRKWKSIEEYHRYQRNDLRDTAFNQIYESDFALPASFAGWRKIEFSEQIELGRKDILSDDDRVIISLDKNPNVKWSLADKPCEIAKMVEHSHHIDEWYKPLDVLPTVRSIPVIPLGEAENVKNGFSRRFSTATTNLWISDTPLPATLTLSWRKPIKFNMIAITFDNLTQHREDSAWESGKRVVDFLVKSYAIDIWRDNNWQRIVDEQCNYHRFRRHIISAVDTSKLRLTIFSTHSSENNLPARVYQISIYDLREDS